MKALQELKRLLAREEDTQAWYDIEQMGFGFLLQAIAEAEASAPPAETLAAASLAREALASARLDGETHVVEPPDETLTFVLDQALAAQEAPKGHEGKL